MNGLLYASSIVIRSLVAVTPLYNNIIDIVRGGLFNADITLFISISAVKDFQLALFLENLKVLFF
jgi:hypothetical protein